jgi:predicted phosphodiesterase
MPIAALYDVHGNLPALQAVLADVEREQVETIVCGGDLVWGPLPAECLALLREAGAVFIAGNCERTVLAGESERDRWCRDRLGDEELAFVSAWPLTLARHVPGVGRVLFCHATPRSDEEIVTKRTPDDVVAAVLAGTDAELTVSGHTHVQFDRRAPGAPRLVNAGSVGLAYEGESTARWALLGPDVTLRQTAFDTEAALEALHRTGFPQVGDLFDDALRGNVSPEEATSHFETMRGGA